MRVKNKGAVCMTDNCDDPAEVKGLCTPCYQFERYHMNLGHGAFYFSQLHERYERSLARCKARLPKPRLRRRHQ